ncbi:hypothetical protein V5O48_018696 [Marasmius crinis-equi]|uniref:PCI domain-containing protein n=1 Tax=Marasmius crinis-equi TaxID=585013 RepID=A0ABR3EKK1_9AGAR
MDRDVDMDIDEQPSTSAPKASSSSAVASNPDPATPLNLDLEAYISSYTGRTAIDRLIRIVSVCPPIASEAFVLAVQKIQEGRDPTVYQALCNAYEGGIGEMPALDGKWVDETIKRNQAEKVKLEGELKTYSNNMIKESIRMGHRDLAEFYRSVGDYPAALKHWTKSREFCTTSQHVLDGCISILELLIEQRNYAHLPTYIFKAESALEGASSALNAASKDKERDTGSTAGSSKKAQANIPDIDVLRSKLDFANGLSQLSQGNYERAAYFFLRLSGLGDWFGKLVSQADIAIYGVICGLSSQSRSAFKAQVIENLPFSAFIEQEPYIREIVESYMSSNFKGVLELLSKHHTRHVLDIHLFPHIPTLLSLTRSRLVTLYFTPFSTVKLDRMAEAFGWSVEDTEEFVVGLIRSGGIKGRVDSQGKVLQVKGKDRGGGREEVFVNALRTGVEMKRMTGKLLYRMKLQQLDLVIKQPKNQNQERGDGRGGQGSQVVEVD